MVYKIVSKYTVIITFSLLSLIIFNKCSDAGKEQNGTTYYIEIKNSNDSIKQRFMANITRYASYFENNQLKIMAVDYITGEHPDIHYYKPIDELNKAVDNGTLKILLTFKGNFTLDSTYYSIERFKYSKEQWTKFSDLGFIKAFSRNQGNLRSNMVWDEELVKQVTSSIVSSTY